MFFSFSIGVPPRVDSHAVTFAQPAVRVLRLLAFDRVEAQAPLR
jgi:hypothetical protein